MFHSMALLRMNWKRGRHRFDKGGDVNVAIDPFFEPAPLPATVDDEDERSSVIRFG